MAEPEQDSMQRARVLRNGEEIVENKVINQLRKLDSKSGKSILVNGKYKCKFVVPQGLQPEQTYAFFSECYREKNCTNRISQNADVAVEDIDTKEKFNGKLYLHTDLDLGDSGLMSMSMLLENAIDKKMVFIVSCLIEDSNEEYSTKLFSSSQIDSIA